MKSEYIPISHRWDSRKFRMWREDNGFWVATQPLLMNEPMFARPGYALPVEPARHFVNRDPRIVLHELQLAIAKAAA